jgi:large subunit ribosomal protein L23
MINQEFFFNTIISFHVSEKSHGCKEKNNVLVLKVNKHSTKREIKLSVMKMFQLEVKKINVLNIRGKRKRKGKNLIIKKNWKKAYIFLKPNQNLDFLDN